MDSLKKCKTCEIEKELKKFSGRSAVCSACIYSTKKDASKQYYIKNKEHIVKRVLEIYHFRHDDLPKQKPGRKKIELVKPTPVEIVEAK